MNVLFRTFLFINGILFSYCLSGQINEVGFDQVYGLNPLLYNGKLYDFYPPVSVKGDQYFTGKDFLSGTLLIKGMSFTNTSLNYDIYNQQILLKFISPNLVTKVIVIPDILLNGFSLDHKNFVVVTASDSARKIYQVIGSDSIRVFYFWKKKLELENATGTKNYTFTAPIRESFVVIYGKEFTYHNNRKFILAFDSEKQKQLKKFMRQNHISVKKSPDELMNELITYCNSL